MLSRKLRPLFGVLVSMGAFVLATTTPAFSQITPEPLQPTIKRIQPNGETIQPITPESTSPTSPASNLNPALNPLEPIQVTNQFTFTSLAQYSNCLEDMLQLYLVGSQFRLEARRSNCRTDVFQAYKGKQMPKQQALELIQMADFYATSLLTSRLYPPRGQRQRVQQVLGFTYAIDANGEGVQRFAH